MLSADQEWFAVPGASPESFDYLKCAAEFDLPESYLRFLAFSNGGEGPLPVDPFYLCLDPAEMVARTAMDGTFAEFFPHLFVIGSNGAGEAIAFDLRKPEQLPVIYFDMTNIELTESVCSLAESFDALIDLIGRSE